MKLKNALFATLLSAFAFSSCSTDDEGVTPPGSSRAIQFTTTISGEVKKTRAAGSSWSSNDKVGIFMKKAGQNLSAANIIDGANNKSYITNGNGTFSATSIGESIYYPENGSSVDFVSYYPHQEGLTNFTYYVNVANQDSQEAIDLLYSNNMTGVNANTTASSLSFSHQLAKIAFNIEAGKGVSSLDGLTVEIAGSKTQAAFSLVDGKLTVNNASLATIQVKTTKNGAKVNGEAILIPDEGGNGRVVSFTLPSIGTYKWTVPTATKFEKGKRYTYNITLTSDGSIVEPSVGWMETPVIESIDNTMYVTHMLPDPIRPNQRNYSMLYDTKYKLAYWVAYPLHKFHYATGSRTDKWGYDPQIQTQYQPNLKKSYQESTLDRGHQLPSGDRTYLYDVNASTFYYSNMTAQEASLNQKSWANLENKVRTWASSCDTMYVVTGAMITSKIGAVESIDYATDAAGSKVGKPKYYYKALAQRHGNTYYTIAFKMPNIVMLNGVDFNDYRLTVKELEEITGFKFFPGLGAGDKDKIVTNQWN